jgi:hypothetical protein
LLFLLSAHNCKEIEQNCDAFTLLDYLAFKSVDFGHARLFQIQVKRTKLDLYVVFNKPQINEFF